MGLFGSRAAASGSGSDGGDVPSDLLGLISLSRSLLLFSKSSYFEFRTPPEILSTRILSLTPACACATFMGTVVVGFSNGSLSEFDQDLALVTTFCAPGASRAHAGSIIQVCSTESCHLLSIGQDGLLVLWDNSGLPRQEFVLPGTVTAMCASDRYLWVADNLQKMHVLDFTRLSLTFFWLPGAVKTMAPIPGGLGCLAVLATGGIVLFSASEAVAQFSSRNTAVCQILPLNLDPRTGVVVYATVDTNLKLNLNVLESTVETFSLAHSVVGVSEDKVFMTAGEKIVPVDKRELIQRAAAKQPPVDLPREAIVRFLRADP
jgi:hypothetical protein